MTHGKALPGKPEFILFDTLDETVCEDLRREGAHIVIFGAGRVGSVVLDSCRERGISIAAFCDNNQAKTEFCGLPVVSPTEAVEEYPDSHVLLALSSFRLAAEQLACLGLRRAYGVGLAEGGAALPPENAHSSFSHTLSTCLAVQKAFFDYPEKLGIGHGVNLMITERCSLKCLNCANLMQYYRTPDNFPVAAIFAELDRLCDCVDYVADLQIIGGEPLMHPDFHLVAEHAAANPKIRAVGIYTNGTMLPCEEQWSALLDGKIYFNISDYGTVSRHKETLIRELEKREVQYHTVRYDSWSHWCLPGRRGLGREGIVSLFRACKSAECLTLLGGKLYHCAHAANGVRLGAIPDHPMNFVDVAGRLEARIDPRETGEKIWPFIYEQDTLPACDYCLGHTLASGKVEPAVQAPGVLPLPVA